jgi:hypothetical protein
MGRNKWDDKLKFTNFFDKTPKIPKNKVENLWTPSKQIKKPPNFKTSKHLKTPKMTRKLKTSELQNTKTKNLWSF